MREVAIFVCNFCKESFDSADAIACHILNTHESNKTVKKLRERLTLQETKPKSSKLKPSERKKPSGQKSKPRNYGTEFYCDICDYKTVYRSTYKRHLLTHEKGSRQHKCMYCSYAAIQPHNLKIHMDSVHPFGPVDPVIVYDSTREGEG